MNRAWLRLLFIFLIMTLTTTLRSQATNYTVTNNNDSGLGSLRQAILDADAPGIDSIYFNDVGTIVLSSSLTVTGGNLFLGNANDTIKVTIDTNNNSFSALVINGSTVVVRNLAFIRGPSGGTIAGTGIEINGDYVSVVGCRIGTDWNDTNLVGFSTGIDVSGNVITPVSYTNIGFRPGFPGDGNIISRNGTAIYAAHTYQLKIQSNWIGLNNAGDDIMPNSYGVSLVNNNVQTRVGGDTWPDARNIICGTNTGIRISGSTSDSFGNSINSVWMNLYADGTPASINFNYDILLQDGANGNFIGKLGSTGEAGNLILGAYIAISGTASNNSILGNTLTASGPSNDIIDLVLSTSNNNQAAPIISFANPGTIQGTGSDADLVELYLSDRGVGEQGGALSYLGSATVNSGNWSFTPSGLSGGEVITAISTDPNNNSSEFAINVLVEPPTPTATHTNTFTPTSTTSPTITPSLTVSSTPSSTITVSPTISPTSTPSPSSTSSPIVTHTPTFTITSTITSTSTHSPTATRTPDNPLINAMLGGRPALPVPNPARDKMLFVLHLDESTKVEVIIFNVAGERITSLVDTLPAGQGQSLSWNCSDISPGLYLARIIVNGQDKGSLKVAVID